MMYAETVLPVTYPFELFSLEIPVLLINVIETCYMEVNVNRLESRTRQGSWFN